MDVSNCFHTDILINQSKKQYFDIILGDFQILLAPFNPHYCQEQN